MLLHDIKTSLSSLKGVGESTASLFARMGVLTVGDILAMYPREYDDRTQIVPISNWRKGRVRCPAVVTDHEWVGRGEHRTLCIILSDGMMDLKCVAFGRAFMERSFPVGTIVAVTAKAAERQGRLEATAFELTRLEAARQGVPLDKWQAANRGKPLPDSGVFAIYPLTEGLKQKSVRKIVSLAINGYALGVEDEVPEELAAKYRLLHKKDALRMVHIPKTMAEAKAARRTLIYEELFTLSCTIARRAYAHRGALPLVEASAEGGIIANANTNTTANATATSTSTANTPATAQIAETAHEDFNAQLSPRQKQLLKALPFALTTDQMQVIADMNADIDRGYKERAALLAAGSTAPAHPPFTMQRLLQGDVGSGKTLAALFVCLRVIDWRGQCAIMAPTELLARQHADNASRLLEPLDVRVAFLSGNIKAKQRGTLLSKLLHGSVDLIIGTHALFSSDVRYNDLCLAVIDEQHKFGVLQRQAIIAKGRTTADGKGKDTLPACPPHLLMMSATPIPQSLALTVFGDLDVSSIHTMPAGRRPIATYLVREGNERNAYEAVRRELQSGHQAYFVYPAIEEGEGAGKSAEAAFEHLSREVYPEYRLALLHSRIGEDEQMQTIADFRDGKVQGIAATTVIEVGVDVPNATCIVIENADRFGMAQLHQLRGRVGRGAQQSYCFLIYSKDISEVGIQRMKALRESTDGFFIAEEDLRLRGPGEVTGTMQSGVLRLSIADIERDADILRVARADAISYVATEKCPPRSR